MHSGRCRRRGRPASRVSPSLRMVAKGSGPHGSPRSETPCSNAILRTRHPTRQGRPRRASRDSTQQAGTASPLTTGRGETAHPAGPQVPRTELPLSGIHQPPTARDAPAASDSTVSRRTRRNNGGRFGLRSCSSHLSRQRLPGLLPAVSESAQRKRPDRSPLVREARPGSASVSHRARRERVVSEDTVRGSGLSTRFPHTQVRRTSRRCRDRRQARVLSRIRGCTRRHTG